MEKLNNTTDLELYLQTGYYTKPFLRTEFVWDQISIDYNAKKSQGLTANPLISLMNWINHNVKYVGKNSSDFIEKNQFSRTAKEIWASGKTTGCTDYAILFATFARQLGYPTTLLDCAQEEWLNKLQSLNSTELYVGHTFCECFNGDKWILVDPTTNKLFENYSIEKIELPYRIFSSKAYIPYERAVDRNSTSLSSHTQHMQEACIHIVQ